MMRWLYKALLCASAGNFGRSLFFHMADIMNRSDVLNTVAAECKLQSIEVDRILKAFEGAIARSLAQGGEVRIAGFGTFKTSARAARTSRNPRTGEPVDVPARTAARFIPGKGLKTAAEGAGNTGAKASAPAPEAAPTKGGKGAAKGASAKAEAPTKAEAKSAPAKKAGGKGEAKGEKAPAKKKK